jgi:hypothetical protein
VEAGWHHYRLRMVDLDGSVTYSEVASVLVEERPGELHLFPNPAQHSLSIHCNENPVTSYSIRTPEGREVLGAQVQATQAPIEIDLSGLRSGIYFLQARQEDGSVKVKKFTKL